MRFTDYLPADYFVYGEHGSQIEGAIQMKDGRVFGRSR